MSYEDILAQTWLTVSEAVTVSARLGNEYSPAGVTKVCRNAQRHGVRVRRAGKLWRIHRDDWVRYAGLVTT